MTDKEEEFKKEFEALLKQLDDAVASDVWDQSTFLTAIGKKLKTLRDEVKIELDDDLKQGIESAPHIARRIAKRSGMSQVFVSLYCAEGHNITRWESVLANLGTTIISRPIYKSESEVRLNIRTKSRPQNEAYCVVFIHDEDLATLQTGEAPTDGLGNELLILKRGAINPENIIRFHHMGLDYDWHKKHLKRREPNVGRAS